QTAFDLLGFPDWRRLEDRVQAEFGGFRPEDLYDDALRTERALHERGRNVAILANQPASRSAQLLGLGFRPDVIAMSGELGVSKPDPAFFARGLELMGNPDPMTVVYVGDRIDRDVHPCRACGFRAVWLRRGPWGRLQEDLDRDADLTVWSLDEMVERLPELDG